MVRYETEVTAFLLVLPGIDATLVDFSRDGKSIAYVRTDGTLWRSKVDGSNRFQLTYTPMQVTVPHWSPEPARPMLLNLKTRALSEIADSKGICCPRFSPTGAG